MVTYKPQSAETRAERETCAKRELVKQQVPLMEKIRT
jgi:hypothetical protein